jgi:hypothetical protein
MAVAVQSYTTATADGDITINKPTGTVSGDLLVYSQYGGSFAYTLPSGWSYIDQLGAGKFTAYKVAGASEPASYTIGANGSSDRCVGGMLRINGQSTSTPIDVHSEKDNGASTTITGTAFTPTYANSLIIFSALVSGYPSAGSVSNYALGTSNPTWTEHFDVNYGGVQFTVACATGLRPETSASGTVTATSSVNKENSAFIVVVPPEPPKIVAEVANYTLTGKDIIFKYGWFISTSVTAYTLTGINILFKLGKGFVASTQTYTLTGIDALITSARKLSGSVTSYTLSGIDVILHKVLKPIEATTQTYLLSGIDISMFRAFAAMVVSSADFLITSIDISISRVIYLISETTNYILSSVGINVRGQGSWKWFKQTKNTSTFTKQSKNTSSWSNEDKTSSTWTNENKS